MAISMTNAVGSLRRARRLVSVMTAEYKRAANRQHRRSRHRHERELRTDVHADYVPPRKLTGFDVVRQTRIW